MTRIENPGFTDNIIECQNLTIYRDFHEVLHNASCSIPKDSLTFIVGENGSGKTTLVQSILGLLPINEGEMELHSDTEKDLIFGYVPQSVNFSKHVQMTVSEYLKYSASVPSDLIEETLNIVDFPETHLHNRLTELSGGQTQKLLLAAELFRSPDILFLDEPLSNVDNSSEKHIIDVILGIKNQGVSIVIITHDWQMVSSYADHVICLNTNFLCELSSNCICKNSLSKINIKNIQKATPDPQSSHPGYCYIENI
jgi:ABC-type Mn2+/Zn2+ transport system ATPase subunit